MDIENPISTIKKAVQNAAEELAAKESKSKPEAEHYKRVLDSFKFMRGSNREMLEKIIFFSAQRKEIKDRLEPEQYSVFREGWDKVEKKLKTETSNAIDEILKKNKEKEMTSEEFKHEIAELTNKIHEQVIGEVKNDPKVIAAFHGKEKLLDEMLDFIKSTSSVWS